MYSLKPMSSRHLDLVLAWRNDPRVRTNMYTNRVITRDEHQHWFDEASRDPSKRLLMCVGDSDQPVGVIVFSEIDLLHRRATWAFYSGDSGRRKVGTAMERLALDYAFENLELEKLNCEVLSFNLSVVEFHRKHGFRIEGIFRAQYHREGVYYDVYRLAIFRIDWLEHVRPALERTRDGRPSRFRPGDSYRAKIVFSSDRTRRFSGAIGETGAVPTMYSSEAIESRGAAVQKMLVAAELSRILSIEYPGPGTTYLSQTLQFLHPVLPDTQIEFLLRIASRIGERATVTTTVSSDGGETVVAGEAEVILPTVGVP